MRIPMNKFIAGALATFALAGAAMAEPVKIGIAAEAYLFHPG